MKSKSVVPLNRREEGFLIFNDELTPDLIDVRGETVYIDLGDYTHLLGHAEMLSRIRWIKETLQNPEEIRQHRSKPYREIYLNTIYAETDEPYGETHLVVVNRGQSLKFWTSFIPDASYAVGLRKGKLLWKPRT